jgi:uncharacterized membrane protein YfcA
MTTVITDPWLYAVAVPAVLLMGLSKSGFMMGFGSLATPLLVLVLPAPQAAALMMPLLLAMDVTGVRQLWRERDRDLLRLLLPAALIGTAVGTLLFGLLPGKTVAAVVGGLTLLFLAQRLAFPPRSDAAPPSRVVGFLLGIAGGFTSFVAHAGGPPIAAYVLPLRLAPLRLSGTLAVLFGFINLSKWIPYAALGLFDRRTLLTSLVLLPLAPVGVWLGIWATRRIASGWFYRVAYAGMFLTGVKLLWDGLR